MSDMSLEEGARLLGVIEHSEESDSLGLESVAIGGVIWVGNFGGRVNRLPVEFLNKHIGHGLVIGEGPLDDSHASWLGASVGSRIKLLSIGIKAEVLGGLCRAIEEIRHVFKPD